YYGVSRELPPFPTRRSSDLGTLQAAEQQLEAAERALHQARHELEQRSEEHHRLAIDVTEAKAERRRVVERVETEWKRPFEDLVRSEEHTSELQSRENLVCRL